MRCSIVALLAAAAGLVTVPAPAATTGGGATAVVGACQQGRQLELLGRWDAAANAYAQGLKSSGQAVCSRRALMRLQASGTICATARALEDAGLDDQARAAYAGVLKLVPRSRCASEGLTRLQGDGGVLSWIKQAGADLADVLGDVALLGLLTGLAAWLLLLVLTHTPVLRRLPGVRALRRARLQLQPLDDGETSGLGAGTTALLRARLNHDANDTRIALASGPSDTGALDGLADVSDQAKLVVALLRLLRAGLPKRDWVVSGVLQGRSTDGEGLSLAVDSGGRYRAFGEFWAHACCVPAAAGADAMEPYRSLTIPAAGWLGHQVAAANDPRSLLTQNPDSWALFTVGLHFYDLGRRAQARVFYERALGLDGQNIAALANLGVMDAEELDGSAADAARLERAEERLRRALELLER